MTDSFGSRRSTARTDEWTSNPGTTLTDAIWEAQGRETDTTGKLLPTPTAATGGDGERPDGFRRLLAPEIRRLQDEALLPTPVANPDNPGSGGELRAALEHGPERRNGTGVDSLGRPNEGRPSRLLPTPQAADGDGGRQEKGAMRAGGKRPSGQKGTLPLGTAVAMSDEISESPFAAGADDQLVLLPTPDTVSRKSRRALTSSGAGDGNGKRSGGGMSSPPGLEQVAEVVAGEYPHDFPEYEDLAPATRRVVDSLLPTPQAADGDRVSEQGPRFYAGGGDNPTLLGAARRTEISWGVYEGAVRRWEATCGREAPAPTDEKGRLAPDFVTWMLGYPEGWVEVDGISRTAQLRILGNSVQVQVAAIVGKRLLALDRELTS